MASEAEKVDLSSLRIQREPMKFDPEDKRSSGSLVKWALIVIGVVAIGFIGYVSRNMFKSTPVVQLTTVAFVAQGSGGGVLTASGYIVPQRKASVASKGTGRLVFLGVEEGDRVQSGQVIARLENNDIQAGLEQARANLLVGQAQVEQTEADLERVKRNYERNETLLKSNVITDADFEIVRAEYRSAQARVNSAKAGVAALQAGIHATEVELENTIIRAPFDATVLTKNADVGEIVAPFAAGANSRGNVVTLADMSSLMLEADVSESNIERVKIKQPCEITLDALPEKRYRGEVWKVVPTADRSKATILTKIRFIDIDNRVLPEMSAKVNFLTEAISDSAMQAKPKLMVNTSAVVERNGRKVALSVVSGKIRAIPVMTGERNGNKTEIVNGLTAGDKVIDNPTADLNDGDTVTTEQK
ncbi:efflux RND transporter periplasmic adaptor subunit [bacterium]|nr:efflux RND transporter periplasmic adaptor subunit [bacterium]NUN45702.1 efflux RND transporter periplasmic adaptor subunit [bacterium]